MKRDSKKDRKIEAYHDRIFLFIRKKIDLQRDAEDLCQDVLVAALVANENGKLESVHNISAYIHGIAVKKVKDWYREKYKHPSINVDGFFEKQPSSEKMPLLTLVEKDLVYQGLRHLNGKERRIIFLCF